MNSAFVLSPAGDPVSPIALYRAERARAIARPAEPPSDVLGENPAFRRVLSQARRAASTHAAVFITGESGTGKECLARYIHAHSPRRAAPLIPVNCAALPEALLESELFGHCRGAFTGAVRDKPGIFETAHHGTILLDELAEMPKPMQAKLLRVVQDGVVRRVGSEALGAKVDVRVIAATNRDPTTAIAAGLLREDLYYRLHVVPLHLPPLRERREDIPVLARHFLRCYWERHRGPQAALPVLTPEALTALAAHPWRGNVRELQNTMEHLVVLLEPGARITPGALPLCEWPTESAVSHAAPAAPDFSGGYRAARERALAEFEASYVAWFEGQAGRNLSRAARRAGIERTTLYRLLGRQARRGAGP